jgi:hypothetical protein
MRSEIEPPEHIMRAPVSAQGGEWRGTVAEKPQYLPIHFCKPLIGLIFLWFDETVLPKCGENLRHGRSNFDIHDTACGWVGDGGSTSSYDLLPPNRDTRAPQDASLPGAATVGRPD